MDQHEFLPVSAPLGQPSVTTPPVQLANIPTQSSERSFRRFEDVIAQIVRTFPEVSTVISWPLAPKTYCCRLRDAMTSLQTHNWPTHINVVTLNRIRPLLRVVETENGIRVEPRKGVAKAPMVVSVAGQTNDACVHAFGVLLHHRLISNVNLFLTSDQLEMITSAYDVSHEPQPNGSVNLF